MSHRGGYPVEPWARQGTSRGSTLATQNTGSRGFSQSSTQSGIMAYSAGTSRDARPVYSAPAPANPLLAHAQQAPFGTLGQFMPSFPGPREDYPAQGNPPGYPNRGSGIEHQLGHTPLYSDNRVSISNHSYGRKSSGSGSTADKSQTDYDSKFRTSPEPYPWDDEAPTSWIDPDYLTEGSLTKTLLPGHRVSSKTHPQRRPSNRDEFDGPHQFLDRPSAEEIAAQERNLPHLPTNLYVNEQDEILAQVNDLLSKCAFDFVAKYQFPIPLEPDKRPVRTPADREWTEWVYLLKRLATKRRVPARVLYNSQIKQLVTVLENSLEMRHAAKHQSRPLKDDRNVLQLISAGLQVARILKDASCMEALDSLYVQTERKIHSRRSASGFSIA